ASAVPGVGVAGSPPAGAGWPLAFEPALPLAFVLEDVRADFFEEDVDPEPVAVAGTNFSESELMQNRRPVGGGPSGKTWPRWAPQSRHMTSTRGSAGGLSGAFWIRLGSIGRKKLGQPVPESNLVCELNSGAPQQTQLYVPFAWFDQYLPVNAVSVAFWRVTANCSGVSTLA